MSLRKIRVLLDNAHNNYAFLQVGDGPEDCYIQLKGSHGVDYIYVDENGKVYNEHNKPYCCTSPDNKKIARLEWLIDELQQELECIKSGD
jgi:hypothetical protein